MDRILLTVSRYAAWSSSEVYSSGILTWDITLIVWKRLSNAMTESCNIRTASGIPRVSFNGRSVFGSKYFIQSYDT